MAHKVILPPQKNYIPQFLKQRDINSYYRPSQWDKRHTICVANLMPHPNRSCPGSNLQPLGWVSDTRPMCHICLAQILRNWIYLELNIFLALIIYLHDDVSSNVFTLVCILLPFFTEKNDSFLLEYLLCTSDFCKPSTFPQDSDIKYGCSHRLFPDTSNNHY